MALVEWKLLYWLHSKSVLPSTHLPRTHRGATRPAWACRPARIQRKTSREGYRNHQTSYHASNLTWSSKGKKATSTWQVDLNLVGGGQKTLPFDLTRARLRISSSLKSSALRNNRKKKSVRSHPKRPLTLFEIWQPLSIGHKVNDVYGNQGHYSLGSWFKSSLWLYVPKRKQKGRRGKGGGQKPGNVRVARADFKLERSRFALISLHGSPEIEWNISVISDAFFHVVGLEKELGLPKQIAKLALT